MPAQHSSRTFPETLVPYYTCEPDFVGFPSTRTGNRFILPPDCSDCADCKALLAHDASIQELDP